MVVEDRVLAHITVVLMNPGRPPDLLRWVRAEFPSLDERSAIEAVRTVQSGLAEAHNLIDSICGRDGPDAARVEAPPLVAIACPWQNGSTIDLFVGRAVNNYFR